VTGHLDGAVAVVTGAGDGLGRAEALALAEQGAAVVVNDVASPGGAGAADRVVEEIAAAGGRAVAADGDVSDWEFAQHLVALAIETFGDLNVLVNNAGILRDRMLFTMSEVEWDDVIRVHLKGHAATSRWATAYWRDRSKATGAPVWGRIVNTASEAFLVGSAGQANYAAAKAGIVALTLATAQGCAAYGVTANAICPRAATAMTSPVFTDTSAERKAQLAPAQVAELVAYLGRRSSTTISGQVLVAYANQIHLLAAPRVAHTFQAPTSLWDADALDEALGDHFAAQPPPPGFAAHEVLELASGLWPQRTPAGPGPH
jgi:NAD(P)-dependent dehydrogenase (short-subunit alcohol dehydrogenase family)